MAIFFCLFASQAYAQMKLEIIPLKSRTVEEMIPIVRSILGGQGTVTGMSGQLIVRTTPRNLTEVKKVLAALDTPLCYLGVWAVRRATGAGSTGKA